MTRQPGRLGGWSRPSTTRLGWRRTRDWTGWHTALAALIGAGLPLVIGIFAGAFGIGQELPYLAGDPVALEERYRELWTSILEQERELAYSERLYELVTDDQDGDDAPWAVGFRAGWFEGRRDAIAAMREAAVEQELRGTRVEWKVLRELGRSLPPRQ